MKDISINDSNFQKLLHNDNYYQHIFKKTEKIVAVVFYILNNITIDKKSETHTSNLASKAHFAHENALRTLEMKPANAREVLEQFAQSLIGLESTLNILAAVNVLAPEVISTVTAEIGSVLRSLNQYMLPEQGFRSSVFSEAPFGSVAPRRQTRGLSALATSAAPTPLERTGGSTTPSTNDRRTRILTILEAKGEATIKDISDIISDVSEKTVQRELNAMIDEGKVQRQGERRWSRYILI